MVEENMVKKERKRIWIKREDGGGEARIGEKKGGEGERRGVGGG